MKYLSLILILLGVSFSYAAAAELSAEQLQERQEELEDKLGILSFDDDDFEDETTEKEFFVLTVRTSQDRRDENLRPTMRVTVKLFDKKTKTTVFAQGEATAGSLPKNDKYSGTTEWEFHIPFGEMKKPKLVAAVVELGVKEGGGFIIAEAEYDKVESVDEILNGDGTQVSFTKRKGNHIRTSSGGD